MITNILWMLLWGCIGVNCHWLKRWGKKQTKKNWFQYMRDNRQSTVVSYIGMFAAVIGLVPDGDTALMMSDVSAAWLAGYSADSLLKSE